MSDKKSISLPSIPAKRYFTIGEVSQLCAVKPHVLRYWEQEFTQLRPVKRRGNRRYYQRHEVLLIRRIRQLLYDEGFTIHGARGRLDTGAAGAGTMFELDNSEQIMLPGIIDDNGLPGLFEEINIPDAVELIQIPDEDTAHSRDNPTLAQVRTQLEELLALLEGN